MKTKASIAFFGAVTLVDGEPVVNPFDVETLPPGFYRLVERPVVYTD